MRVFPAWAEELGLPTRTLQGHDLPLDAPPSVYRDIIGVIRDDPRYRGALVTTHKMAVFRHARDLFDDLDELALLFGEISSVARRGDRLTGAAKDPVTVRLALDEFVPADHFATSGGAALVLGSGGAGCALTYALGRRSDVPAAIICTALEAGPLDHQRELHARAGIYPDRLRYVVTSSTDDVDALLSGLPPGSLVVNATGMGKDRPGSPVGAAPRFPRGGLVWDFNYRGSLEFLAQARGQRAERRLHVEDGWRYFVHGWASVIADVFEVPMPPAQVARLAAVAEQVRR
ncbi:MAG: shikimate dehydrogenase family protein, partial [Actinomycetes bacterium]